MPITVMIALMDIGFLSDESDLNWISGAQRIISLPLFNFYGVIGLDKSHR